jgi:uroporphyrinogen decarboxylase
MTSRERVLAALAGAEVDRVPVALGFCPVDLAVLAPPESAVPGDVDVRFVRFEPSVTEEEFARFVERMPFDTDLGGPHLLRTYAEWRYDPGRPDANPLAAATKPADLEAFPWPDMTAASRNAGLREQVGALREQVVALREQVVALHRGGYAVGASPPHLGGELFETAWRLRGLARFLLDLQDNPAFAHALLDRLTHLCLHNALLLVRAGVDILVLDDDVGMPGRMILSPEMWRAFLRPRLASIIEAARAIRADLRVLYHSDGTIEPIIGDLIDIGVDALNPVQPDRMDPLAIKRRYGDRLTLWGTVGAHATFAYATPEQIKAEVRHRIETLGPTRLVLCPAYDIDDGSAPWENVAAFMEAATRQGR